MTNARMWRGVRCIVLLATALSLAAPKPGGDDTGPDAHSAAKIDGTEPAPASLKQEPVETSAYKQPCRNTPEDRESDLCAQWEAADAARDAAIWAMWGTLFALVGIAGLWVQIYLTRKAVEDTSEATEAMRAANDISQRVQRPWVSIEARAKHFVRTENSLHLDYEFTYENVGKASARRFNIAYITLLPAEDRVSAAIDGAFDGWKDLNTEISKALLPGERHVTPGSTSQNTKFTNWHQGPGGSKSLMLVLVAVAHYWSDLDKAWHRTERSFTFGPRSEEFMGERYIPEELIGDWRGKELADEFVMSSFRSGETT